jgi:hypothetical protein
LPANSSACAQAIEVARQAAAAATTILNLRAILLSRIAPLFPGRLRLAIVTDRRYAENSNFSCARIGPWHRRRFGAEWGRRRAQRQGEETRMFGKLNHLAITTTAPCSG